MVNSISNRTLITLTLVTAVLMLVFLVFSAKSTTRTESPPAEQTTEQKMEKTS